tara:strand:- start:518 stop:739 length:222 start_codon:yes stop_codon:yes gene_type:complete
MSDYNFEQLEPEIFDSLYFAQSAINENPLPFSTMKYEIKKSVCGGYLVNTYFVKQSAIFPIWHGFLNTKTRES